VRRFAFPFNALSMGRSRGRLRSILSVEGSVDLSGSTSSWIVPIPLPIHFDSRRSIFHSLRSQCFPVGKDRLLLDTDRLVWPFFPSTITANSTRLRVYPQAEIRSLQFSLPFASCSSVPLESTPRVRQRCTLSRIRSFFPTARGPLS
jgi:hypothetical protein